MVGKWLREELSSHSVNVGSDHLRCRRISYRWNLLRMSCTFIYLKVQSALFRCLIHNVNYANQIMMQANTSINAICIAQLPKLCAGLKCKVVKVAADNSNTLPDT